MVAPDPPDVAAYGEMVAAYTVGTPEVLTGQIRIVDYDPAWPGWYRAEEARIRAVLGDRVVRIEHAGSTSVPGLAAKAIIDIVLEVADSSAEAAYVPDLEDAGYRLRVREPNWFQHRMFKGPDTEVNVHTFSADCPEVDRMLLFRDWLRRDQADRERYAAAKRELAGGEWKYVQQYADAKSAVIAAIMARARTRHGPVR
jgi:GrpB-like predicted nucleotidyltransferase (UPF0157 family)